MSSIYIHIPFCRQACHYCDFHFSTRLEYRQDFLTALLKEIELRKDYLEDRNIQSVYFGGGTPSLLSAGETEKILESIVKNFTPDTDCEITLEANPEDLSREKIRELKEAGVNRLSIGVQSFYDEDLQFMNRIHTSEKAKSSVKAAQDEGFSNISIDLIYGMQTLTDEKWNANLNKALSLEIQHLSAYCLTVEPGTALNHFIRKRKIENINDEKSVKQFGILTGKMKEAGFLHYEISNFSLPGYFSRHNSHYWLKGPYLGLGPSAHSYNGISRQWNVSNNQVYMRSMEKHRLCAEQEILSARDQYNEYILTSLRTMWGSDLEKIEEVFGKEQARYCLTQASKHIQAKHLKNQDNKLFLTEEGKLLADGIAADLFAVE